MRQYIRQATTQFQTWLATVPIIKLRASLFEESQLTLNYLALLISSCLIATFGLINNSAAVIIGAMIIAPLMLPLRGLAFAAIEGDLQLLRNSSILIAASTVLSLLVAWLAGSIINIPNYGSEVLARTQPNLIDLLIALAAGGISGYAKVRPEITDALPGTAIAVALMPPLCVVGLTFSQGQWEYSWGAFLLYLTNLLGITLACTLVYVLAGYTRPSNSFSRTLSWTVSAVLMGLLVIPLGISFWQLVRQSQLNYSVQNILRESPLIARQDVEVLETQVIWDSLLLELVVRASEPISPEEVRLFEQTLQRELGRPFKVLFHVTETATVEAFGSQ